MTRPRDGRSEANPACHRPPSGTEAKSTPRRFAKPEKPSGTDGEFTSPEYGSWLAHSVLRCLRIASKQDLRCDASAPPGCRFAATDVFDRRNLPARNSHGAPRHGRKPPGQRRVADAHRVSRGRRGSPNVRPRASRIEFAAGTPFASSKPAEFRWETGRRWSRYARSAMSNSAAR